MTNKAQEIFSALSVMDPDPKILERLDPNETFWESAARLSVIRKTYSLFLRNLTNLGLTQKISAQFLPILRELSKRSRHRTAELLKFSERLFKILDSAGVRAIPLKESRSRVTMPIL